jgi:hypothetical protein
MHRAIVLNGIFVLVISLLVFFLRGRQARRELDVQMNMQQLSHVSPQQPGGYPPTTS